MADDPTASVPASDAEDSPSVHPTILDRVRQQGPWDQIETTTLLRGASSLPMPVKIASPDSLQGCFDHLQMDGTGKLLGISTYPATSGKEPYYDVPFVEYEKGVIYADRRLDLCKMVLGPLNINDLMDSLDGNTFIKHFLLGSKFATLKAFKMAG